MRVARYVNMLGIAACFAATAQPAVSEEGQPSATGPVGAKAEAQPPAGASGLRVYIDPQTGGFLTEPPQGAPPLELSPAERNAFSTSHEGLVEAPSPAPGGGVGINLQGRFQSPLTATVGADGKVTMQHQRLDARPGDQQ